MTADGKCVVRILGTFALGLSLGCQPKANVDNKTSQPDATELNRIDAQKAFQQGSFLNSLSICEQLLKDEPGSVSLLMLAGESATKLEKFNEAIDFYGRVPETAGADAATARWAAGEIHFHLGQATACIESLQASLRINPDLIVAHERLVWMLGVCGRRRELLPHLMALVRADQTSIETLLDLGNPWTEYQDWQEIERFRKSAPDDLVPNLVYAKKHQREGDQEQAESLLTALVKQQPNLMAAQEQLGNLWLSTAASKLKDWNAALPQSANQDADIWYIRGQWLEKLSDPRGAVRCFIEAVQRDPSHPLGHAALARLLNQIGENSLVEELRDRSSAIQRLNQTIDRVRRKRDYEPTVQQVAELTFSLGRYWESIGWCQYGMRLNSKATWHVSLLNEIRRLDVLNANMPHTIVKAEVRPPNSWLDRFPLPDYPRSAAAELPDERVVNELSQGAGDNQAVKFANVASQVGVEFVYRNSFVDRAAGKRMFEITGGGIGVLDYDCDGTPDLFLAQATPWPIPETGPIPGDTLFRNLGPQAESCARFNDVTQFARIEERRFGQGVCVADINGDGFDDVYVANVGENQLWLNQGDGTLQNANSLFPPDREHFWTVSALASDLDGNGLVEIYDVNYVTGDDVYTLRCEIAGKPRACPPLVFKPAPQKIWVPNDEGAFEAYDWGSKPPLACYGLGAVAYRPVGEKQARLFVAVDQQANLLLHVEVDRAHRHGFFLEDTALLSGIAYDHAGQAQACMGIAAGDVDHNGEVDLLVTNFYQESNTLYLQKAGSFVDATMRTGLVGPSRPMLGFGAQFLDAELDGDLDLAVLNGHIDDHSHIGIAEKMRPQFFQNTGNTRFKDLPSETVGDFFGIPGLGRGLATADVDGDGLLDLLCSDLEAPLAVLGNRSIRQGHYINVQLIGVQSDRNGFFTEVTVSTDGFESTQQLTAGSGYIVSNQRTLHFALPKGASTVQLTVHWPSGKIDCFERVRVNGRFIAVEGHVQ